MHIYLFVQEPFTFRVCQVPDLWRHNSSCECEYCSPTRHNTSHTNHFPVMGTGPDSLAGQGLFGGRAQRTPCAHVALQGEGASSDHYTQHEPTDIKTPNHSALVCCLCLEGDSHLRLTSTQGICHPLPPECRLKDVPIPGIMALLYLCKDRSYYVAQADPSALASQV